MAIFQRKARKARKHSKHHLNWMGGTSFEVKNPIAQLRMAASSCFFGEPMYYHRNGKAKPGRHIHRMSLSATDVKHLRETLDAIDPVDWRGQNPSELMETTIDAALAHDPEATLQEASRLRTESHMRTTPQVILVRAANHPAVRGTGLVRAYAASIIARADEPAVGLAYQLHRYGKPIPNALKKAWRDALQRFGDYALAKYRLESMAEKTVDVVNLVHPRSESTHKLARGVLKNSGNTWEAIVSANGSNRKSWEQALKVMGHMALLRNLRNLLGAGVKPELFVDKLREGARTGKQLPFRYYSAYKAVGKDAPGQVRDAIEDSLMTSLDNLPYFRGRTMSLCDNSGSAQGTATSSMGTMKVSTIANLTGILAGMRSLDGHLGVFGDRLETLSIRAKASVFDQLDRAEAMAKRIGMGTENGIWLFWDKAIKERQHWDNVFVFSDMQAGHGGLYGINPKSYRKYGWTGRPNYIDVPKLIAAYRKEVNPNVRVFLVQVAGYKDTLVPEFYRGTYILGGWGPGLLKFAAEMAQFDQGSKIH